MCVSACEKVSLTEFPFSICYEQNYAIKQSPESSSCLNISIIGSFNLLHNLFLASRSKTTGFHSSRVYHGQRNTPDEGPHVTNKQFVLCILYLGSGIGGFLYVVLTVLELIV